MNVVLLCRLGGNDAALDAAHDDEMEGRFWASAPGADVTLVRQDFVFGVTSVEGAMRAAVAAGAQVVFGGYPTTIAAPELDAILRAESSAVVVSPHYGNLFAYSNYPSRVLGSVLSVAAGLSGRGNLFTTWGPGLALTVETSDLRVDAQSWAAASAAAVLTRYPEAQTDARAALRRMLAGAQPVPGAARWTEHNGFGVVRTLNHALTGAAVRMGETPTTNVGGYAGAVGSVTAVAGGYRYAYTSVHPFLVAYLGMPPPGEGFGGRWTFYAKNHHGSQSVRLRSRNGGAFVVLAPGEGGTYTLDSFSPDSPFFIETPNGVGGEVDVTVTGLVQDVYEHVTSVPPLAPAGGVLSPLLDVQPEGRAGRYRASFVSLGGTGTSLRVGGVERLQTSASSAVLYLPAGASTVEARALLLGGGVSEAHAPGTAALTVEQGYVPPAPTLSVQRVGGTLYASATAEGADDYAVTAQAGAETPTPVVGDVAWPAYLPARVVAAATGPGGVSAEAVVYVPAVRSAASMGADGLHPRLLGA